jgi:hypothetical protein
MFKTKMISVVVLSIFATFLGDLSANAGITCSESAKFCARNCQARLAHRPEAAAKCGPSCAEKRESCLKTGSWPGLMSHGITLDEPNKIRR